MNAPTNTIDTYQHAGLTIHIVGDDDPTSPQDHDNAGTIYSWTPDFGGDQSIHEPDYEINCPACSNDQDVCSLCGDQGYVTTDLAGYMRSLHDAALTIPLRFSDHGSNGAQIYELSDDPNCALCFTAAELAAEWADDGTGARAYAAARIKELDDYLQGNAYGYVVQDAEGNDVDSCWGFIGDGWKSDAYVREAARGAAEAAAESIEVERAESYLMACRDVVTVAA